LQNAIRDGDGATDCTLQRTLQPATTIGVGVSGIAEEIAARTAEEGTSRPGTAIAELRRQTPMAALPVARGDKR
jgi:hypothetical protein